MFALNGCAFALNGYEFALNGCAFALNVCAFALNVYEFALNICAFALNGYLIRIFSNQIEEILVRITQNYIWKAINSLWNRRILN